MKTNTDTANDIPEFLFVLANEHISLDTVDSYNVLADECLKYHVDVEEVLSIAIRSHSDASK